MRSAHSRSPISHIRNRSVPESAVAEEPLLRSTTSPITSPPQSPFAIERFNPRPDPLSPPQRTSSRSISPSASSHTSPLRLQRRTSAGLGLDAPIKGKGTYPAKEASISSSHAREGAPSFGYQLAEEDKVSERELMTELTAAIGYAIEDVSRRSSADVSPRNTMSAELARAAQLPPGSVNNLPTSGNPSVSPLQPFALGESSGTPVQPKSPGHAPARHRRASSGDHAQSPESTSPLTKSHRRASSGGVGVARHPSARGDRVSNTDTLAALDVDKIRALLKRNKPLPRCVFLRDDIKSCRSAGERAVMYARKINDLSLCESGLEYWITQTRQGKDAHSMPLPLPRQRYRGH